MLARLLNVLCVLVTHAETFIKLLLPSYVAGLIIGKDGAEITHLMQTTGTNVKFSPGRELYPATQDRVCVITGSVSSIVNALRTIYQRIGDNERIKTESSETVRQLKMLVSNIASGMVIGKSGQSVKSIQQDCSVRIQISSKEEAGGLPERILTIQGETEHILSASKMVLERITNDPEADKWKRLLSYSSYSTTQAHGSSISSLGSASTTTANTLAAANSHPSNYSMSSFFQSMSHPGYSNMANFQSAAAAAAAAAATGTTSAQGAHAFTQSADSMGSASSLSQAMFTYMYAQSLMSNSAYFSRYSPAIVDGVNMTIPGATLATFEIAIPEVMISAVLGAGGKLISDLIQTTGTHVQLSQKGDYIPGTYNRKLTITGPILGVQSAHLMIMQSIVREQEPFRKQGLI